MADKPKEQTKPIHGREKRDQRLLESTTASEKHTQKPKDDSQPYYPEQAIAPPNKPTKPTEPGGKP